MDTPPTNRFWQPYCSHGTIPTQLNGHTTCQPVLTALLQPRHNTNTTQWTHHLPTSFDSLTAATAQYQHKSMDTPPTNRFWQPYCTHGTIPTQVNGHTTCQPVLTALLQPRHNTNTWQKHYTFVISWRWAHSCPKHVEQLIKEKISITQKWHLVGSLFTLNYDARSTTYQVYSVFNVLMCKFYKFYVCAVVGVIIEYFKCLSVFCTINTARLKSRDSCIHNYGYNCSVGVTVSGYRLRMTCKLRQ